MVLRPGGAQACSPDKRWTCRIISQYLPNLRWALVRSLPDLDGNLKIAAFVVATSSEDERQRPALSALVLIHVVQDRRMMVAETTLEKSKFNNIGISRLSCPTTTKRLAEQDVVDRQLHRRIGQLELRAVKC
jgi:hypothetical protein